MKILFFGRGAMATTYAWALEKSANHVEFYVRPGRSSQYGPFVDLEMLDFRTDSKGTMIRGKWPITMREDLNANHDFDLIVISINHYHFSEAVSFLSSRIGKATVLIFNHMWPDPQAAASLLPNEQIVWGFPGAGGGFDNNTLKVALTKSVNMGIIGNSGKTKRYEIVRELFHTSGFSVSEPKDFRSLLGFQFVMNAGLAAQTLKAGGYSQLINSSAHLKETVKLIREMIPLLKAKGDKPNPSVVFLLNLPAGIFGIIVKKFLSGVSIRLLEDTGHLSYESISPFARDVLDEARRLGVLLPRLTALEPVFKIK